MSFNVHNITSSDVDMAVRYDPSTSHEAWQKGAQTIDDYFSDGGLFWAEPISSDGEYIAGETINTNVSGDATSGVGLELGGKVDSDTENDSAIGIATGTEINSGVHIKSDNTNDSDNDNSTAMDISSSTGIEDDPDNLQIDPPAQEDCTPPDDCPPPAKKNTRAKPKKLTSTTPQLRAPQISRRTTRASAGADALKRAMEIAKEKEEQLALPSKTAFVSLKRKKEKEEKVAEPSKSAHDDLKGEEGGKSPLRKRKQPKREAKNKKK
jgi:hypothetical protein